MREEQFLGPDDDVYSAWKFAHQKAALSSIANRARVPPVSMQIDPTGRCGHDCLFCAYKNAGWKQKGMKYPRNIEIDWPVMSRLIREMQALGIKSVELTGGGEPTLYSHFDKMMQEIGASGMELALVTNGSALTRKRIDEINPETVRWVRFSADAASEYVYAKVHRVQSVNFYNMLAMMQYIAQNKKQQWHKDFRLGVSFVIVHENICEIEKAAEFYRSIGADNIRYSFAYDVNQDGMLNTHQKEAAFRELDKAKAFETKKFKVFGWKSRLDDYWSDNSDLTFCSYQYGTMAIGADGGVWPCCITKYYPRHCIGNVNDENLSEILMGDRRNVSFDPKRCPPCWMQNKIKFVDRLLNFTTEGCVGDEQRGAFRKYLDRKNPPHVNFP
jgi:MoaA/NifB/PqqE/SkfB family radical SAM enzyme